MNEFNYNEWLHGQYFNDNNESVMNIEHKRKYNALLESLRYISSHLKTLDEGKLYCSKRGLDYQEYLEHSIIEAKKVADDAIKNRKYISLCDRTKS